MKKPKCPPLSGSKTTWKNYEKKINLVVTANQKIDSEYNKALKEYEKEMARRKKIAEKAKSVK